MSKIGLTSLLLASIAELSLASLNITDSKGEEIITVLLEYY
jgi:hypothetical protein